MLAQLNVQLCGDLIQLKNNTAEKSDAVAPECETSASGFAEEVDELSCRFLDDGSIVIPVGTPCCIPVILVCCCILWENQDFTRIIVLLILEEIVVASVVGDFLNLFFFSHDWFP